MRRRNRKKGIRMYIAGPMSGRPQFNYPAFDAAAEKLRDMGYDAISPAEMDDPETRKEALASPDGVLVNGTCNGETWGDFLSRDVKLVADGVDAICLLPEWEQSRGARLEAYVAINVNKPVYEYVGGELIELHPVDALHTIAINTAIRDADKEKRYG